MRLVAFLILLAATLAPPAHAASSPGLEPLEQQLASLVAESSGEYGLAALDLGSGQVVSINGDEPFPMASTVKIAIAANYLAQVENGRRSLDDVIGGRSAARLIDLMLIHSDNSATDLLLADLGGPRTIQAWLTQNQIYGVRVDRNIARLLGDRRDLRDIRDSSTPKAMVALLQRLDGGTMLKSTSRSYLLDVMRRCTTGKNRMKGLLPFGTRVEHKTGTLSGLSTDVGFITLPNGRRLAVAFFARGGSDRPYTIARAARAIYDGFAAPFRMPFAAGTGAR